MTMFGSGMQSEGANLSGMPPMIKSEPAEGMSMASMYHPQTRQMDLSQDFPPASGPLYDFPYSQGDHATTTLFQELVKLETYKWHLMINYLSKACYSIVPLWHVDWLIWHSFISLHKKDCENLAKRRSKPDAW